MENNKGKVIYIDPIYIRYRKMWREDRWKFSAELVKLTIKLNRETLNEQEQHLFDTMNRIVEENNGDWLDENKPTVKKRK